MIYINHELKAIYIRIPKTGGKFISGLLQNNYGFTEVKYSRLDISDFFDDDDGLVNSLEYYEGKVYSIRKKGLLRYYLDDEMEHYSHLGMTKERWDSYFKFTFVSNPYLRIIKSYNHCNNRIYPEHYNNPLIDDDDSSQAKISFFNASFGEFINSRETSPNLMFFSSFINQHHHIIDNNNQVKLQFIGRTEFINEDLIQILKLINFHSLKHIDSSRLNENALFEYKPIQLNFEEFLDDNLIQEINSLFDDDFKAFNFKKFETLKELLEFDFFNPFNNLSINEMSNYNSCNILFELNKFKMLDKIKMNSVIDLLNYLNEYIDNIEKIYKVTKENPFNNQYKLIFKKIEHVIKQVNNNQENLFNNNILTDKNKIDKVNIKCTKCDCFLCFNHLANDAHEFLCKQNSINN
jgi:hypothetical protein